MRVFLFQDRFAELVRAGTKRQTIRARARCKPGDELSLRRWTGKPYRSKQEILRSGERCNAVLGVLIEEDTIPDNDFAQADGFKDWGELLDWFRKTHGLPFEGECVRW
jgi:hypothetical protein